MLAEPGLIRDTTGMDANKVFAIRSYEHDKEYNIIENIVMHSVARVQVLSWSGLAAVVFFFFVGSAVVFEAG